MNIRTRSGEERAIEKEAMILKEGNSQEDDASAMSDQRAGPAADIPVDAGETDAVVGPSKPHLLQTLGPGLITGASDDDPSGIGTYGIVNLTARGMLVVSVARRLGSEGPLLAYCAAPPNRAGPQKGALGPLS
jgi:hypothetical protein